MDTGNTKIDSLKERIVKFYQYETVLLYLVTAFPFTFATPFTRYFFDEVRFPRVFVLDITRVPDFEVDDQLATLIHLVPLCLCNVAVPTNTSLLLRPVALNQIFAVPFFDIDKSTVVVFRSPLAYALLVSVKEILTTVRMKVITVK